MTKPTRVTGEIYPYDSILCNTCMYRHAGKCNIENPCQCSNVKTIITDGKVIYKDPYAPKGD